jgi:hypothetical protein
MSKSSSPFRNSSKSSSPSPSRPPAAPKGRYLFPPEDEKYNKEFLARTINVIDDLHAKAQNLLKESLEASTALSQQMIREAGPTLHILLAATTGLNTTAQEYAPLLEHYNEFAAIKSPEDAAAFRARHDIPEKPEQPQTEKANEI